jgi:lipoprotein NlpD
MFMRNRYTGYAVLLAAVVACSTGPINAPVDSRDPLAGMPRGGAAGSADMSARSGYYIVRRGDTLYSVAWQNGLNFRQLADMNGIRPPYTIYVGESLRVVPAGANAPVSRATPAPRPHVRPAPVRGRARTHRTEPHPTTIPARAASSEPAAKPEPVLPPVVSRWVWPVKGPLLRNYSPNGNGKKGIDIGGRTGQPVKAAADGKVVYSGSGLVGYGRLIIIKHNDNLLSAYGHNSELLVAEGDYVKAGQVIAKMGSTGTSSTRLYFEIRQDGKPVNPLSYLPRS